MNHMFRIQTKFSNGLLYNIFSAYIELQAMMSNLEKTSSDSTIESIQRLGCKDKRGYIVTAIPVSNIDKIAEITSHYAHLSWNDVEIILSRIVTYRENQKIFGDIDGQKTRSYERFKTNRNTK